MDHGFDIVIHCRCLGTYKSNDCLRCNIFWVYHTAQIQLIDHSGIRDTIDLGNNLGIGYFLCIQSQHDIFLVDSGQWNKRLCRCNTNLIKQFLAGTAKTVLKAETDGKVTELKVKVGAVPEGQVATIQSDNKLIISVIIPEYEIKNAKVGMNALITTNSSDKKISGKLTRISPTANAGETSGFSADISIDDAKDLYIGTNAKAEIIVSEKKNVLMVPKDAVKEVGGKYFLMVKGKDNQFIETEVTLGEENDYYVEVSGSGIKEGSEILADLTNYNETTEGVENESKGEA